MTLTEALGVAAMGSITAGKSTYNSAIILLLLGSLIAIVAIVSLEVFSPAARPDTRPDESNQQNPSVS